MLEVVCETVSAAGIADRTVVLGARAEQIAGAVDTHGARAVVCERWRDGQAASLRCGLESLDPTVDEALIVLGDGPHLSLEAIRRVSAGSGPRAADYGKGSSHPVVLPLSAWADLPARRGPHPLSSFLRSRSLCKFVRQRSPRPVLHRLDSSDRHG